jgi:hypothetical protein
VTPLVSYLVSDACDFTHEIFDVGGGRYARIFIGMAPGWVAPRGTVPSVEDIREHMDQIREPEGYIIPDSIADEMKAIAEALKG